MEYAARPARRHNKIGSVESANATIRLFVQRLLMDDEHQSRARGTKKLLYEILSRGTFLNNVLYGGKQASSFELARGFTPSLWGMRQSPLSRQAPRSHQEQVSRRALQKLMLSHPAHPLTKSVLPRGPHVYFYVKTANSASWMRGFVLRAGPHVVRISAREGLAGRSHQAAYEDVRLVPSSPRLLDLDKIELGFGDVQGSGDSDEGFTEDFGISSEPTTGTIFPPTESPMGEAEPPGPEHAAGVRGQDSLVVNDLGTIVPPSDPLLDEVALWVCHTEHSSMLTSSAPPAKGLQLPAMDINAPTSREMLPKDIGDTHVLGEKDINAKPTSLRQEEFTRIQQLLGHSPVT